MLTVVLNGSNVVEHPLDLYVARPTHLDACLSSMPFTEYHRLYVSRKQRMSAAHSTYIGLDSFGRHVLRLHVPRLVRYAHYSPATNPEGSF